MAYMRDVPSGLCLVSGRAFRLEKPVSLTPKVLFWHKWRKKLRRKWLTQVHLETQTHNCFTALFLGLRGEPVPEEIFFWTLSCKGR